MFDFDGSCRAQSLLPSRKAGSLFGATHDQSLEPKPTRLIRVRGKAKKEKRKKQRESSRNEIMLINLGAVLTQQRPKHELVTAESDGPNTICTNNSYLTS